MVWLFLCLIERCFDNIDEGRKQFSVSADRFLIALFVVEIFHLDGGDDGKFEKEEIAQSHTANILMRAS